MNSGSNLAGAIRGPNGGGDFEATREGSLAKLRPLKANAAEWLRNNLATGTTWHGDTAIIELAYFGAIAEVIVEAGFTFEREVWLQ